MGFSAKCFCQVCSGHIEFDEQHTGTKISCPHCGMETTLYKVPKETLSSASPPTHKPPASLSALPPPVTPQSKKAGGLYDLAAVLLFIIGAGLVFNGCSGEFNESLRAEGSAIRQTVYAVQYGCGFLLIALSLILGSLVSLIRK